MRHLNELIQNEDENKLLSIVRDPVSVGVNPGIHIWVYPGDIDDIEDALRRTVAYLEQNTEKFRMLEGPISDRLASLPSGYIRYQYNAWSSGELFIVEEFMWIMPMDGRYLVISTGTAPENTADKQINWDSVHSVRSLN